MVCIWAFKLTTMKETRLKKIILPNGLTAEMSLFGSARAFELLDAFCNYGFKGVKPKNGTLDKEQNKYFVNVLAPIIDRQKAAAQSKARKQSICLNNNTTL